MPEVSIIIPTYNRVDRLKSVVSALERQVSTACFEVIIVSDGSTDETDQFLSTYSQPLDFKALFQNNQGPAAARNLGIAHAKGDIILLNFFATWCVPCQIEAPQLEDSIWQVYKHNGVTALGIDVLESLSPLTGFIKQDNLSYPVVRDTVLYFSASAGLHEDERGYRYEPVGVQVCGWIGRY